MPEAKGAAAAIAEYVQRGNNINYTCAEGAEYMQVVPLAGRIAVAMEKIPPGGEGTITLQGAFNLPAATGMAFEAGAQVYWDKAKGNIPALLRGISPPDMLLPPKPPPAHPPS
ncbi:MAG: DUF2190 family protein [Selenomonadaceae bacterium]|nr:DUF2190 family protein [Selenomonadaceae bacterium]